MLEIQAHRGNSELALRSLLAASPTSIEIDVCVTADGAVVVSHEVRATTVECLPSPLLGRPWRGLSASDPRALRRLTLDEALAAAGAGGGGPPPPPPREGGGGAWGPPPPGARGGPPGGGAPPGGPRPFCPRGGSSPPPHRAPPGVSARPPSRTCRGSRSARSTACP